jgi:hypothetical protein
VRNLSASKTLIGFALWGLTMGITSMAHAAIYNVNTTDDLIDDGVGLTACHTSTGTCSLRAAIMKANQVGGSNIIHLPAGTYALTIPIPISGSDGEAVGDLNITSSLAIIGQGADRTFISANQIDRVLDISPGQFVSLSDVTIRAGLKQGSDGGGIRNAGITTIARCVIEDNYVGSGNGAGIYSTGSLDITRSTIRENRVLSGGDGGGIDILGTAIIRESTISNNDARNGGGIFVRPLTQFVYVINSTISGNVAYNYGGGIYSVDFGAGDVVGLYNASVVGNDASTDTGDAGQGGGVYANVGNGARFIIANTLIANNTINDHDAFNDCVGVVDAYGFNLFSLAVTPGCTFHGNGNTAWGEVNTAGIGPLQDNGGFTLTHALLPNSEAINNTTSQGCIDQNAALLSTDQRGEPRVMGVRCDVGAFEYDFVLDRIFKNGFE